MCLFYKCKTLLVQQAYAVNVLNQCRSKPKFFGGGAGP